MTGTIDIKAQKHIEVLTGSADTPMCFRAILDTGGDAVKLYGTVTECWDAIMAHQKAGCGIFLVVNEGGNTDAEIHSIRALFVDADGIPLPTEWHTEPDFIVHTSPGKWHAYWRVVDLNVGEFNEAQRRLATHYGTDAKVCNPSRVMRLAGTLHLKDPKAPRLVTLETLAPSWGSPRSGDEIVADLPPVSPRIEWEPQRRAPDTDLDSPRRVGTVQLLARHCATATNLGPGGGGGSDDDTLKFANALLDISSPETVFDAMVEEWMPRCQGKWDAGYIKDKIDRCIPGTGTRHDDYGCTSDEEVCELFNDFIFYELRHPERQPITYTYFPNIAEAVQPRVRLMSYSEVMEKPAPVMVVESIVPANKLIMPWSGTGEGKTYFAIELATAIAMRRPAFGRFKVLLPGDSGVVIMFLGEDHDEAVKGRITAIAQHYGRSVEGLVFTADLALPIDNDKVLQECINELHRVKRETGKPIDAIFDDTLGRTLGQLKQNDAETGNLFTEVMEALIREFQCPIIVNSHEPKAGGTISGTQRFLDNVPVTPHIEGYKDQNNQLLGFSVKFEPKYRIGPTPKPFTVEAQTIRLPAPVNGSHTDLVFKIADPRRTDIGELKQRVIGILVKKHPARVDEALMVEMLLPTGVAERDRSNLADNIKKNLKRHVTGVKNQVKPDLAEFVLKHLGQAIEPYQFQMPDGWEPITE